MQLSQWWLQNEKKRDMPHMLKTQECNKKIKVNKKMQNINVVVESDRRALCLVNVVGERYSYNGGGENTFGNYGIMREKNISLANHTLPYFIQDV